MCATVAAAIVQGMVPDTCHVVVAANETPRRGRRVDNPMRSQEGGAISTGTPAMLSEIAVVTDDVLNDEAALQADALVSDGVKVGAGAMSSLEIGTADSCCNR